MMMRTDSATLNCVHEREGERESERGRERERERERERIHTPLVK